MIPRWRSQLDSRRMCSCGLALGGSRSANQCRTNRFGSSCHLGSDLALMNPFAPSDPRWQSCWCSVKTAWRATLKTSRRAACSDLQLAARFLYTSKAGSHRTLSSNGPYVTRAPRPSADINWDGRAGSHWSSRRSFSRRSPHFVARKGVLRYLSCLRESGQRAGCGDESWPSENRGCCLICCMRIPFEGFRLWLSRQRGAVHRNQMPFLAVPGDEAQHFRREGKRGERTV
jgi:hypothetical protein